jgi:hypothetical protein
VNADKETSAMTIQTRVRAQIGVKTWMQATTYVVNEIFNVWSTILAQRGISNQRLNRDREVISNGLFTWLSTRHLQRVVLEVGNSDPLIERWDMNFEYADPWETASQGDVKRQWQVYLDEISNFTNLLSKLPTGTSYRIVVSLADEVNGHSAPPVQGWSETELHSTSGLQNQRFGRNVIDTKLIGVNMEYWGSF